MTELFKIRCDDCKFKESCVDYGWDGCIKFTPAPSKPMTNEEWIKYANTEQLADLMSRMVGCSNCPIPKDGRNCIGTYSGCWHEIIKWLKQPCHNEVEK